MEEDIVVRQARMFPAVPQSRSLPSNDFLASTAESKRERERNDRSKQIVTKAQSILAKRTFVQQRTDEITHIMKETRFAQ
jgi:hypothetical protein